MRDSGEEERNRVEERISRKEAFLPLVEGVRTIQRNRRGPMIRPSTLYSIKQITENRNSKDRADSRRKHSNRTNHDHESLIESLLRQPLESSPQQSEGKSAHFDQSDRYGPPAGGEDVFEKYDASSLSPSAIFTVPCFFKRKSIQCRNVVCFRALLLVLILSILIIVVTVTNQATFANDRLNASKFRNSSSRMTTPKLAYNNNTNPRNIEKGVTDQMTNLEHRRWVIGKDVTMDVGFATDDMIIEQSDIKDVKGEGIDLTDNRLDFSNNGNDTVRNMNKSNVNTIDHE